MAQELKRIFGTEYNPRPGDIEQRPIGMNEQSGVRILSNNMGRVEAPMNWVPIAQFPNIKPLGQPNSCYLKRPAVGNNISTVDQRSHQIWTNPKRSYLQAATNKQGPVPVQQQYYPSLFLPSQQMYRAQNNQPHFR